MYNPSILDLLYLKLTPQGSLMTFTNAVYYTGSNAISNIWAKTSDSWTTWTTLLTTTIVWDLLQTYSSILTNAINPIDGGPGGGGGGPGGSGGTLTIGNTAVDTNVEIATRTGRTAVLHLGDGPDSTGDIHIGNGLDSTNEIQILHATDNGSSGVVNLGSTTSTTNLYSPLTPLYTNLPVFYDANANNVTYGTKVGAVGQIIYSANNTTHFPGLVTNLSVTLSVGTWLLTGECIVNTVFSDRFYFGFNTVANDTNMFCGFGPSFGYNSGNLPGGLRLNTIFRVTSGTPTIFLINRGYNFGMAINNRVITATRLA